MDELPKKEPSQTSGLTLLDLKKLSESERHLINWLRQQRDCHLLDIAVHLCEDEETILKILSPLIDKGFIQAILGEGEPIYQVKMAPKRGQQLPTKLKDILKKKSSRGEEKDQENQEDFEN